MMLSIDVQKIDEIISEICRKAEVLQARGQMNPALSSYIDSVYYTAVELKKLAVNFEKLWEEEDDGQGI